MAGHADEPVLRQLLRTNSLGGWIQLAFEREPDAFAATFGLAHSHDFIITYEEGTGTPVGLGERFVYDAYVNGQPSRLPYLGSLRVSAGFRRKIRLLREGYRAAHELLGDPRDLRFALTSITADNEVARRLLTAGISGFPRYVPVGEMITVAMRTKSARSDPRVSLAPRGDIPELASFLQGQYRKYQFAPVWHAHHLERLDSTFLVIRRNGCIVACLALWDQTAVKQTRVCGYSKPLDWIRPVLDLPRVGSILKQVYLSHIAVADEGLDDFAALLRSALSLAHQRGSALAVAGLSVTHPLISVLRRYASYREYRSLLHVVQWPGEGDYLQPEPLRIPHPEIALL